MKKIICKSNLDNVKRFVEWLSQDALTIETKTGIQAIAMLGQVAQETGWGDHVLKVEYNGNKINSKNLFNIKASATWQGKKGVRNVWEIVKGKKIWVDSWFRVYDTYEASFADYADYILNAKLLDGRFRYEKALAYRYDAEKYIEEIHKAGYATDPMYSTNIKLIMAKYFNAIEA